MFILFRAIPGCLGSLGHFKNKYSYPIEQGQRHSTTKRTLAIGRKTVKALVRKISIWFLRRTKVHIKEQLPKKDDRVGSSHSYLKLISVQMKIRQVDTLLSYSDEGLRCLNVPPHPEKFCGVFSRWCFVL